MTRLDKKIRRLAVYRSPFDIATDLGISESVVFNVLKYGQVEKRAAVSLAAIKADYVSTHIKGKPNARVSGLSLNAPALLRFKVSRLSQLRRTRRPDMRPLARQRWIQNFLLRQGAAT